MLSKFGVDAFLCGIRIPVGKLAGVAADAQDARCSESPHKARQLRVAAGKEMWISELRGFIAQSGEVAGDLVAKPVGPNSQAHRGIWADLGKAQRMVKDGRRGGGREANKVSTIHSVEVEHKLRGGATCVRSSALHVRPL